MKIKIQNIVALGYEGEYDDDYILNLARYPRIMRESNPDDGTSLSRLKAHIKFLMKYTAKKHEKKINENIKKNKNYELITRLVLNEYSFYPKFKPITLEEYKNLAADVNEYAKKFPANIHFILGTIPVLWPNNVMHNACIYVETARRTGKDPKLHHLEKTKPHKADCKYIDDQGNYYTLYSKAADENLNLSADILLKDTSFLVNAKDQSGNTLRIKTATGKYFIAVNEICYEHTKGVGHTDTKLLLEKINAAKKFLPKKGAQTLIANTCEMSQGALVSHSTTHADPGTKLNLEKVESYKNIKKPKFGNGLKLFTYYPKKIKPLMVKFPESNPSPKLKQN